jgi:hypothetical protein
VLLLVGIGYLALMVIQVWIWSAARTLAAASRIALRPFFVGSMLLWGGSYGVQRVSFTGAVVCVGLALLVAIAGLWSLQKHKRGDPA